MSITFLLLRQQNTIGMYRDLFSHIQHHSYTPTTPLLPVNIFSCPQPRSPYLSDLLHFPTHSRPLRSSSSIHLSVPSTCLPTMGRRAFSCCAPHFWDSLPPQVRNIDSTTTSNTTPSNTIIKIITIIIQYLAYKKNLRFMSIRRTHAAI